MNLIKNNGIGKIHNKLIPNCCLFISLAKIWETVKLEEFNFHKKIFEEILQDNISGEEMVYAILKVNHSDKVYSLGEPQSDILIEHFAKYVNIKLSVHFIETDMKWDLFEGDEKCEGVIVQYNNHFDCAV